MGFLTQHCLHSLLKLRVFHTRLVGFPFISHWLHKISISLICMISKHVKISSPVTCEIEVFDTDTCAYMWHSLEYATSFIFWDNCLVVFILKLCLAVLSMEQTARKRIALQTELEVSISVVGNSPLIYFPNYWCHCTVKVYHVITFNNSSEVCQLFSMDSTQLPFIHGIPYSYTTHNHLLSTHIPSNVLV